MKSKKLYRSIALACLLAASVAWAQVPAASPARDALAQPPASAWLRADQLALQQQVQLRSAAQDNSQSWLPVMQEFKALIDNDPELYMLFTQMFEQIPRTPLYLNDPAGNPQVRNYRDMLKLINQILTQARPPASAAKTSRCARTLPQRARA